MGVKITGLGAAVPANKVTNDDLSKRLDTSDEWIQTRTGIKTRYHANKAQTTSKLACEAGLAAIRGMKAEGSSVPAPFDTLILATTTPDRLCPATAPKVAHELGFEKVRAFDVNAVCSGFVYGLDLAESLIKSGKSKKIMLIGADVFSSVLNPEDRTTYPLFGDAAGAMILEADARKNNVISTLCMSDGGYQDLISIKNGGVESKLAKSAAHVIADDFFKMDGKAVFSRAVEGMGNAVKSVLCKNKLTTADIDIFVPHQANLRIINILAELFDIENEKVMLSLDEYGNTSAASIPLTMALANSRGQLKQNDKIMLTAFGGGLTWGAGLLQWPQDQFESELVFVD